MRYKSHTRNPILRLRMRRRSQQICSRSNKSAESICLQGIKKLFVLKPNCKDVLAKEKAEKERTQREIDAWKKQQQQENEKREKELQKTPTNILQKILQNVYSQRQTAISTY